MALYGANELFPWPWVQLLQYAFQVHIYKITYKIIFGEVLAFLVLISSIFFGGGDFCSVRFVIIQASQVDSRGKKIIIKP